MKGRGGTGGGKRFSIITHFAVPLVCFALGLLLAASAFGASHDAPPLESPRLAEKLTDLEKQLAYSESKRAELESELQSR